jgi:hypothetical protein
MSDFTNEEMAIMESNVNYISYKRSISIDYCSISREMSIEVSPDLSLDKQEKYVRNRVNWLLRQDEYMLQNRKYDMTGYQGN